MARFVQDRRLRPIRQPQRNAFVAMHDTERFPACGQDYLARLRREVNLRHQFPSENVPDTNGAVVIGDGKVPARRIHCDERRRACNAEFGVDRATGDGP